MDTKKLVERIRGIAETAVEGSETELVHVEVSGDGKRKVVRIYIDKADGVVHEDCSFVSQKIGEVLDHDDPINGEYVLEVSSPGIERGLYSLSDFERFAGDDVKLRTFEPLDGQRNFTGKILGVNGDLISLNDVASGEIEIEFGLVKKANLLYDIGQELKAGRKK